MSTSRVTRIIEAMQSIIAKHGLELMQRYPNDLLVHDRRILDGLQNTTCTIAWCVGHSHTHMAVMGVHPEENDMVPCYANLGSTDKYFKLVLSGMEDFKLTEMERSEFLKLSQVRIPYSLKGGNMDFSLFKEGVTIARVTVEVTGPYMTRLFNINYQPLISLSDIDRRAIEKWAYKCIASQTGSLFSKVGTETWHSLPESRQSPVVIKYAAA
jgi:hypothetical protein